jgi:hypothetical protein
MNEINSERISEIIKNDVDAISKSLDDSIKDLSLDNIIDLVPQLIKCVDKYKKLKGIEKKQLVIELINHFIDITDGFGDDAIIDPILKKIVPSVIDNLIKVDKKQLKLKKKLPFCLNLLRKCKIV